MDLHAHQRLLTIASITASVLWLSAQSVWAASSAYSAPTSCSTIPSGASLTSELTITAKSDDLHSVKIKNTSQYNCVYRVGIASYKIFQAYNTKNWINTQQLYANQVTTLNPGEEKLLSINIPSCAYQSDVFMGSLMTSFNDNANQTYGRQGRLLASRVNYDNRAICGTPTATPVTQSTGQVLSATPTPPAKLPSTGPGDSIAITLGGIVAALVGRKLILAR